MADNRGKRHSDDGMSAPPSPAEFVDVKRQKIEQSSPGAGVATPPPINRSYSKSSFPTKSMPPPSSTNLPMTPGMQQQAQQQGTLSSSNNNNKNGPVAVDPEHLSDALIAAGIDLREEEALLSSSAAALPHSPGPVAANTTISSNAGYFNNQPTDFLDLSPLTSLANKIVNENGVDRLTTSKDGDILGLMSAATQEWLSKILTETIIASRYRQNNKRNIEQSTVAKALRQFAIKDKEAEDRHLVERASLLATYDGDGTISANGGGDGGDGNSPAAATATSNDASTGSMSVEGGDKKGSTGQDGLQYRAANATAAMMSFGGGRKGKKYSWMSAEPPGGGGSRASRGGGSFSSSSGGDHHGIKIREAREEPYVVMRDLLGVLESSERRGVEKIIAKGYSRIRD